jgi:hypothetical protein
MGIIISIFMLSDAEQDPHHLQLLVCVNNNSEDHEADWEDHLTEI